MSKQPNIWIDITDFSIWRGHFTGVQRLVYQIASRYASQPNVHFFVFDGRNATFHKASFMLLKERIEATEKEFETSNIQPPVSNRLREMVFSVYHHSPQWLKDQATPARKQQLKLAYHRSRGLLNKTRNRPNIVEAANEAITFSKNDLLLIMGKAWDEPTFGDAIRKLKIDQHFKVIQVVYDLIPTLFPHLFGDALFAPYTRHLFEMGANSNGLLPISESTRRDMQRFCADMLLPSPPMNVIRLGDDFSAVKPVKPKIESLKAGNFILCVGTIEVRKNHQLLYTAYKEGLRRGVTLPKLVIVGGKGWYSGDVSYAFMRDPQLKELVYMANEITDHELRWLYENCKFTIYPSVYEGWGLPVAESLAYGKLCVSSNTSSMPEIAGDLIDYFSPYDSAACLETIVKYLDPSALKRKEEEIAQKYKLTSWGDTFAQVEQFVKTVANG